MPSEFAKHWTLDPAITFLNHGSFGAAPRSVLAAQQAWRDRMEAEPVRFFSRELEPTMDRARAALGSFVGDPDDLAFVANATAGTNTILRSLPFAPGDELLTTDHAYNSAKNALEFVAQRDGASVVVAQVRFPGASPDSAMSAVLGIEPPAPDAMLGSMAPIPLPLERRPGQVQGVDLYDDPVHDYLASLGMQVMVTPWPQRPADGPWRRLIRLSAAAYNDVAQFERLADALPGALAAAAA